MRTNGLRKSGHFALLVIILATGFVFGQNANTGEIKGTVTDSTGGVLPGVLVPLTVTMKLVFVRFEGLSKSKTFTMMLTAPV